MNNFENIKEQFKNIKESDFQGEDRETLIKEHKAFLEKLEKENN